MSTKAKPLPGQTLCSPKCAGRLRNFERTCPSSFSLFRCVLSRLQRFKVSSRSSLRKLEIASDEAECDDDDDDDDGDDDGGGV